MRLLLDTHIYLWWLSDDPKLGLAARSAILAATEVMVSSASIWECAIKSHLGKLAVDLDELVAHISASGFRELPVWAKHAAMVASLPDLHRDPFDRILVAQAVCEPLRLLTSDRTLAAYSPLVEVV